MILMLPEMVHNDEDNNDNNDEEKVKRTDTK